MMKLLLYITCFPIIIIAHMAMPIFAIMGAMLRGISSIFFAAWLSK